MHNDSPKNSRQLFLDGMQNRTESENSTNYESEMYQSIESLYDDTIKKTGGFALYQKLATLLIVTSFTLYYGQFFALNFLLYQPDYECL